MSPIIFGSESANEILARDKAMEKALLKLPELESLLLERSEELETLEEDAFVLSRVIYDLELEIKTLKALSDSVKRVS